MTETVHRLVMLDPTTESELDFVRRLLPDQGFDVEAPLAQGTTNLAELLRDAEVVITRSQEVGAEVFSMSPNLRFVQKYGGRPDRLDIEAARQAGVAVAVMPLRGCIAVAELTMSLVLALSKQLIEAHQATVSGAYRELGIEPERTSQRLHAFQWMQLPNLQEVHGKTLGIVGFGEIGTEVAKRARAFGMEVLYHKRTPLPDWLDAQLGVRPAPLDDVLGQSDFVTLHVPHGPDTERLIGDQELQVMKPSAYLINTCRGPVVDEDALIRALEAREIAGAGLDVFVEEPLPHDSPLTGLDNVILTPHIGGGTGDVGWQLPGR
jgi:glyoxylate reductase